MPFDGKEFDRHDRTRGKLDNVIDLLRTEDRWCQHELKTRDGRRCILGALMYVEANALLSDAILSAATEITGKSYRGIEAFNDDPDTDHTLVLAVLHRSREHMPFEENPLSPDRSRWSIASKARARSSIGRTHGIWPSRDPARPPRRADLYCRGSRGRTMAFGAADAKCCKP